MNNELRIEAKVRDNPGERTNMKASQVTSGQMNPNFSLI